MELFDIIDNVTAEGIIKLTLSKPNKGAEYRKITVSKTDKGCFTENFTEKQVFHKNISQKELADFVKTESDMYSQLNMWTRMRSILS